ncbi:MAG: fibronectin type III domain-containing protein, partial [Muribaculaceae bacterium]|nr:fibronectin type III domain-containing protein [Muribaculaceae bacterium]
SKVNLSWTNPTQTVGGAELSEITKIEVLRNGEVIATLDGNAESYVDNIDEAGKYTYSVIAYNGEDASEPSSASTGFVGGAFDLPYNPDFSQAST